MGECMRLWLSYRPSRIPRLDGGGLVWAHTSILHGWSECMSDLHIPHEKEPRNLYVNTEDCPDITFFDAESGQNLDVDILLAHPWS